MAPKTRDKRVFKNTFGPPHLENEYVTDSMVFMGLKMGLFRWDKLPKEVQDGVHDFLDEEYPEVKKYGSLYEVFEGVKN